MTYFVTRPKIFSWSWPQKTFCSDRKKRSGLWPWPNPGRGRDTIENFKSLSLKSSYIMVNFSESRPTPGPGAAFISAAGGIKRPGFPTDDRSWPMDQWSPTLLIFNDSHFLKNVTVTILLPLFTRSWSSHQPMIVNKDISLLLKNFLNRTNWFF